MSRARIGFATSVKTPERDLQIKLERMRRYFPTAATATLGSGTSTVVIDDFAAADSKIFLSPTNATAQSANAFVSAMALGSFTITHDSGSTGGTFCYLIMPNAL